MRPLPAVIIGFALLSGRGAGARDCRDEAPLPGDARLTVPGADVRPDTARFAGAWVGPWTASSSRPSIAGPSSSCGACRTEGGAS